MPILCFYPTSHESSSRIAAVPRQNPKETHHHLPVSNSHDYTNNNLRNKNQHVVRPQHGAAPERASETSTRGRATERRGRPGSGLTPTDHYARDEHDSNISQTAPAAQPGSGTEEGIRRRGCSREPKDARCADETNKPAGSVPIERASSLYSWRCSAGPSAGCLGGFERQ